MKMQNGVPKGGVYLLRVGPRKYYFGVTINFAKRRREHLDKLRRGAHDNPILQASYNKHSEGSFRFEPIVRCGRETAARTEAWLIQTCALDENCANLRIENGVTHTFSEDTRRRMSEAQRGKAHSDEAKRKIAEAGRGRHCSADVRRKLSEAQKAVMTPERRRKMSEANLGKTLSEEHRRKISEANRGRTFSEEHRRKISEAQSRRAPDSEETRRKKSEASKNRSPETRRKLSEAAKRRWAAHRAAKASQDAEV